MITYKYTDPSNRVVHIIDDDGISRSSCAVSVIADWIAEGNTPLPADVTPLIITVVSMRQARLALLGAGILDNVTSAINSMTGVSGKAAQIEWEYSNEVRRDSPLINSMATALSLSNDQIDNLFVTASSL